ncbi:MAG: chemotaxis protein CheB [Flavobacterium sp.]|nr:MAG: chemotaxis protein CheB [Flavobacterium sp.]
MEESAITPRCKVLIIGGSAGSLEILIKILPRINKIPDFAFVIVVHRKSGEDTTLEELLSIKSVIPVAEVEDKVPLIPGYIYVAPSGYHLLFEKDSTLSLDASEKINYSRPSIDVAFESAAEAFGPAVTGILLSGANADGTNGLIAIKKAGGITAVQDPATAEMPFMPQHAVNARQPDYAIKPEDLVGFISKIL